MIRKEFFFALIGLFLTLSRVNAGNAWFEPLTRFSSSNISSQSFGTITANNTNRDPFSHDVGRAAGKRWVTIQPKTKDASNLWPDKTIKFCFEDTQSRGLFYDLIIKGMDLWYQAGLDDSFKMTEVSDSDCRDKRSEVLFISQGQELSTSVGFSDANTMMLSDSKEKGMLNVLSNVAHEIGHAWGLYHEHQNINFWDAPYVPGRSGRLFGANNFHCKNFEDYDTVMERIQKKIDKAPSENVADGLERHKVQVCRDRITAGTYGFSAKEYLPLMDAANPNPGTTDPSKIDWDSIMLYPSGAGGKNQGNGERLPILTRPNGDEIGLNLVPSPRDVAGLTALYGADDEIDKPLLNDNKSRMRSMFDKVRNRDTGACN